MNGVNVHASCVVLGEASWTFGAPTDCAVLLLGESGMGKSDLALQLIARGAKLVADDRVDLFLRGEKLWARAPVQLAGLLEVRGLGIVRLPFAAEAQIGLAVLCTDVGAIPRMPEREAYSPPETLKLSAELRPPLLRISAAAPSAPAKIVLAAAAFANACFGDESKTS